jgi:hypothetical protein
MVCHAELVRYFPRVLLELANLSPLPALVDIYNPNPSRYVSYRNVDSCSLLHKRHSVSKSRL